MHWEWKVWWQPGSILQRLLLSNSEKHTQQLNKRELLHSSIASGFKAEGGEPLQGKRVDSVLETCMLVLSLFGFDF